jgi:hypothetical protein
MALVRRCADPVAEIRAAAAMIAAAMLRAR